MWFASDVCTGALEHARVGMPWFGRVHVGKDERGMAVFIVRLSHIATPECNICFGWGCLLVVSVRLFNIAAWCLFLFCGHTTVAAARALLRQQQCVLIGISAPLASVKQSCRGPTDDKKVDNNVLEFNS